MSEHVLVPNGTGFFSRGTCTGCDWQFKGHADEVARVWAKYHEDADGVVPLPTRAAMPPVVGDPLVDRVDRRIIELLTIHVDFKRLDALHVAQGLAEARRFQLNLMGRAQEPEVVSLPPEYIALLTGRIAHLSARQREKLRHPQCQRAQQQKILE